MNRCKYLNRMSTHTCWSDGWSRDLDDDECVTSCSDPEEYYRGINWTVNCGNGCSKLPNGRYPINVTASGECVDDLDSSDTVKIKCDISGQWLVTNNYYCDCIDVEDNYSEFPCLYWHCTSSIPRRNDDDSDNRFTKCKSTCPTNDKILKVTCDFDGEWRQARNKAVRCECGPSPPHPPSAHDPAELEGLD